jgi:hypothetical protein
MAGMTALPPDLQQIVDDIDHADRAAERIAASCTDEQFHWRPRNGEGWSIAQCLDHLATINAFYSKAIRKGIEHGKTQGLKRRGPVKPGPFGAMFINSLEPPVKRRMRAPRGMGPALSKSRSEILSQYCAAHDAIRRLVLDSADIDVNRAKYRNPFLKLVNFRVSTGLRVINAHDRRHLWQAEQVQRADGYPASQAARR